MRVLLVRHGESQANVDKTVHQVVPDHEIALSSRGKQQVKKAANIIREYFLPQFSDTNNYKQLVEKYKNNFSNDENIEKVFNIFNGVLSPILDTNPKIRIWQSPYRRTRETASILHDHLNDIIFDKKEMVLLCEQQFGLFDGIDDKEQKEKYPAEHACFTHTKKYNGKFYARYPMGESAFDAACRIQQSFAQFYRDAEEEGINNIIVVCHGTVLRLFTMMWLNHNPEWFQMEKGPGNCAIRVLEDNEDLGYIYGGERDGKSWEYIGNEYA